VKKGQIYSSLKKDRVYPFLARELESGVEIPEGQPDDRIRSPAAPGEGLYCASCLAYLTSGAERIVVQGAHDHRFMNPGGFTFHLGCFAAAVGVVVVGPDNLEYPWFPGHAWRYAHCGQCGTHLGWQFRGKGGTNFFGLVLDRLRGLDD
jgi:hypothetical protein